MNHQTISLSLRPICAGLREDIKKLLKREPGKDVQVRLPLKPLLEQLSQGAVKVPYSLLREGAPAGYLPSNHNLDSLQVLIPLNELVPRMDPALLQRREAAKKLEVPDDVQPLFSATGERIPMEKETKEQTEPSDSSSTSKPEKEASAQIPLPVAPSANAVHSVDEPTPSPPVEECLELSLDVIHRSVPAEDWSALKGKLSLETVLRLPVSELDAKLKKGKATFSGKDFLSWLKPSVNHDQFPEIAGKEIELSLKVLVPLFLKHKQPQVQKGSRTGEETLPDVFQTGEEQSAQPPAQKTSESQKLIVLEAQPEEAPEKPSPIPAASLECLKVEPDQATPAHAHDTSFFRTPGPAPLDSLFGQSQRQHWTPAEIIEHTARLPGVAGALLSTPDGLVMAAHLPPEISGEALAGFLPALFNKLNDLNMSLNGEEQSSWTLSFPNGPIEIFKTGRLYFGVLGQNQRGLPHTALKDIAIHLQSQSK